MSAGLLLTTGGLAMLVALACGRRAERFWAGATLAGLLAVFSAAITVLTTGQTWEWSTSFRVGGEAVHLRLDAISAFFLVLVAVIGSAGTVFSLEYWSSDSHPRSSRSGRCWWAALLMSMGLVLCVANGLHFLLAWEMFTISAYFLITRERHKKEVRQAGWLYIGASHAGTLCLFAFFAALASQTGSWEIGPMSGNKALAPLFWLALAGFGVKAGLFPLHIWLPSAHSSAPSHVSAILSGVAIKMGIYGIVRFSGWLPQPAGADWFVVGLGLVSAVLGVAFALGQHDLKRLLAYHSVENIGIILLGIGFGMVALNADMPEWGALAFAGGLLHVWNHGVFKALLFLGAGSVVHATGTRQMSQLGGLWKRMPWTAGCFALGAAAISGLPPLNGFVSEWLIYLGLFGALETRASAGFLAVPAAVGLAITGALALACFVKVVGVVFLGAPRSPVAETAHECGTRMRVPMLMLSFMCIAIGVGPLLLAPLLQTCLDAWRPDIRTHDLAPRLAALGLANISFLLLAVIGVLLLLWRVRNNGLRRSVTWDCGYAHPTARMQYTAGSFAGIITAWFDWILQPHRNVAPPEGFFPSSAMHTEHTPETVLEKAVTPAAGGVMRLSAAVRRLQHGRIQSYILYLVLGLVAIAVLAWWGGEL